MFGRSLFSTKSESPTVQCEDHHGPTFKVKGAYAEIANTVALNPKHGSEKNLDLHRWGTNVPEGRGSQRYDESSDNKFHRVPSNIIPTDARAFHPAHPEEDRINISYENMLSDQMSLGPAKASPAAFQTKWQKVLAYDRGLFIPRTYGYSAKSADDIRIASNEFADKVECDNGEDACKHLLIEEHRCLQTYQYEKDPHGAGKKCVRWFNEFEQCQWDQHKFNEGYSSIEGPGLFKKRRAYLFYPDFKYA